MVRIKSSIARRQRRKRVLKKAKGQFGHRSKRFVQAKRSLKKGMAYAYRDRKVKKREYKSLWVARINAACRDEGIAYSRFIKGLSAAEAKINRKLLAEVAATSPGAFKKLVKLAKENLSDKKGKTEKTQTKKAK
jgi:large subunit ribosomal protein L20